MLGGGVGASERGGQSPRALVGLSGGAALTGALLGWAGAGAGALAARGTEADTAGAGADAAGAGADAAGAGGVAGATGPGR